MIVGATGEPGHHGEHERNMVPSTLVVVEEPMLCIGVLLDIVGHPEPGQRPLQPLRSALVGAVLTPVAGDNGTGTCEKAVVVGVLPADHTVVHARRRDGRIPRQGQGEPSADAEADDPDPSRAVRLIGQPGTDSIDVVEGATIPGVQVAGRRPAGTAASNPRRTGRAQWRGSPRWPSSRPGCAGPGSCHLRRG